MRELNRIGVPIYEEYFDLFKATPCQLIEALGLLCDHLKVDFYKTNATDNGDVQLVIRNRE